MNKFVALIAAAALALGLGFSDTAMAAHHALLNGDAEANLGAPDDWNADAAVESVTGNTSGNITGPDITGGTNFFSTGEATIAANGSASMDQDVDGTDGVWGCGVEGLQGMYTVTGLAATGSADNAALVEAAFFNPLGIPLGSANVIPATTGTGTWAAFPTFGPNPVPENSATMNVELTGTAINDATVADVGFDNVAVTLTGCLDSFAKISGKVMGAGGKRGQWSFVGSVGILHDGGLVFTDPFSITYKTLKLSCDFTPTDLSFDGSSALVEASYVCTDGTTGAADDAALIRLVPGTGGSNAGGGKDRGDVCVDAIDEKLDIPAVDSLCDDDSDAVALKNGNVHTDDDTSNGP